jgi:hypothetical protein
MYNLFHTRGYWRCRQYPKGPSDMILISYPKVLAVPPISRRPLIRNIYFIPEGIGSAANTLGTPHTWYLFHTRGYWRCRQYRRGPNIYLYFHSQGVFAVPPIPHGLPHTWYLFNTRGYWRCRQYAGSPSYGIFISHPRVLAVLPIPLRTLKLICRYL